jgi:hypothetical protein
MHTTGDFTRSEQSLERCTARREHARLGINLETTHGVV